MLDIGRGALVIVAGYAAMVVLVIVADRLLVAVFPPLSADAPTSAYVFGNLAAGFLAAIAGGWITARIAAQRPLLHVSILVAIIVGLGLWLLTSEPEAGQPAWYPFAIVAIGAVGAFAGGLLGSAQREPIHP